MNVWRISGSRMIRNIRCLDLRPLMSGGGKNSSAAPARCVSFFRKARTTAEPDKEDSAEKTLDLNKRVSKEVQRRQGGDDDSFLPAAKRTDFDVAALSARGFLRNYKPYTPPPNAAAMVDSLTSQILGPSANEATSFDSLETKYNFLCACREAFVNHAVPNSRLHQVNTVGDVKEFYLTPVVTKNPLEMTRDMDLPKNLHVMVEPHRFHPQTDTMFGGISAFPKSSTVVVGLKAKKKYAGYWWKKPL